jgi:hypothetical protein
MVYKLNGNTIREKIMSNTTIFKDLENVKGVGPAITARITNAIVLGELKSVADLINIKGIGKVLYKKIIIYLRETFPEDDLVLTINESVTKQPLKRPVLAAKVKRVANYKTTQFNAPVKPLVSAQESVTSTDVYLKNLAISLKEQYNTFLLGTDNIHSFHYLLRTLINIDKNKVGAVVLKDLIHLVSSEETTTLDILKGIANVLNLGVTPVEINGKYYDRRFDGSRNLFNRMVEENSYNVSSATDVDYLANVKTSVVARPNEKIIYYKHVTL